MKTNNDLQLHHHRPMPDQFDMESTEYFVKKELSPSEKLSQLSRAVISFEKLIAVVAQIKNYDDDDDDEYYVSIFAQKV